MPRLLYASAKSGLTAIDWRQPQRRDRRDIQRLSQQVVGNTFS
jgi:hypothetical protein